MPGSSSRYRREAFLTAWLTLTVVLEGEAPRNRLAHYAQSIVGRALVVFVIELFELVRNVSGFPVGNEISETMIGSNCAARCVIWLPIIRTGSGVGHQATTFVLLVAQIGKMTGDDPTMMGRRHVRSGADPGNVGCWLPSHPLTERRRGGKAAQRAVAFW